MDQVIVSDGVCVDSYHRAQLEYDMSPHKQDLIQLAVSHMSVVLLLSFIAYKWSKIRNKDENAHVEHIIDLIPRISLHNDVFNKRPCWF